MHILQIKTLNLNIVFVPCYDADDSKQLRTKHKHEQLRFDRTQRNMKKEEWTTMWTKKHEGTTIIRNKNVVTQIYKEWRYVGRRKRWET
jgi:hypothetical protein